MVSKQWFVKMEPLAKPALEAVERGDIKIVPERFEKVYNFWLENIKDWYGPFCPLATKGTVH
jgi:valyl-tRNA synthetase